MKRKFQFVDLSNSPKRQKINKDNPKAPSIVHRLSISPEKENDLSLILSSSSSSEEMIESSPLSRKTPLKTPVKFTPYRESKKTDSVIPNATPIKQRGPLSKIPEQQESPHRWKTPEKSLIKTTQRREQQNRNVYFSDPTLFATHSPNDYDRSPRMDSYLKYRNGIIKRKDWQKMNMKARHTGAKNTIAELRQNRRSGKLSPNSQMEKILEDSKELRNGGYADNLWSHMKNVIDFLNPYKSLE